MNHHVAQCGSQADCIIEFGEVLPIGVPHTFREVHQQIALNIRLGLILLDVITVGLGIHEPVDVFRVVSLCITAVFTEFDREAVKGRGMQTLQKSFDDKLGA